MNVNFKNITKYIGNSNKLIQKITRRCRYIKKLMILFSLSYAKCEISSSYFQLMNL
jgi:hypothetical protein